MNAASFKTNFLKAAEEAAREDIKGMDRAQADAYVKGMKRALEIVQTVFKGMLR